MKTKKLRFTHDQLHTIKVLPNTLEYRAISFIRCPL